MKNFIMYLFSIINNSGKCRHTNALRSANEGYCPDCGVYLKKYYYVLRCSCCNHKREAARAVFGNKNEIVPVSKYCPVCGGAEFYVEKYEQLNLVDISYAIEVKEEFSFENPDFSGESTTTVWVEKEEVIEENIKDSAPLLLINYNKPAGMLGTTSA